MQFGFTLKPDHSLERTIDLTRRAEAAGFDLVVPRSRMAREGAALVDRLAG